MIPITRKRRRHVMRQQERLGCKQYDEWQDRCFRECRCRHGVCGSVAQGLWCESEDDEPDFSTDPDEDDL